MSWLHAFLVTQLIEAPIYAAALLREPLRHPQRWRVGRAMALALLASALTHPIAWFVLAPVRSAVTWPSVVAAEAFAVAVEGVYLWSLGLRAALAWSLAVNALSFGIGLCLSGLLPSS